MKKQLYAGFLSVALLSGVLQPMGTAQATVSYSSSAEQSAFSNCPYEERTVLVTLATPKETSLTQKGTTSFDENITVEETTPLGDAATLAETPKQQDFLEEKDLYVSKVSSATYSTKELVSKLKNNAYVVSVEPNYRQYLTTTTTDPFADKQWHLDGDSKLGTSSGISFSAVSDMPRSDAPVVAVMDTGVDTTHEDLAPHIWQNTSDTLEGTNGYNFVDHNSNCQDDNGHGTHCAGSIAAVANNGVGITGISNAKLMSLKVFSADGYTDNSTVIEALNYLRRAKLAGVNIVAVNCSWGGGTSNSTMAALINELGGMGINFVFASGNDSLNHDIDQGQICPYDMYDMKSSLRNYMLVTGSSTPNDGASVFSDYGSRDVDLFAPGEEILSTYHETTYLPGYYDETLEEQLTFQYFPMDEASELSSLYHDEELSISSRIDADLRYAASTNYQGGDDSGSLRWDLDFGTPTHSDKSTYIYLDVTDADLNPEDTHYVSLFMGYEDSLGDMTWEHVVKVSRGELGSDENRFYISSDGKTYFKILGMEADGQAVGTSTYYLDNIGISTANPDLDALGKYEIMRGTSMAAPMVAGAIGLIAELYPTDDSYNRKQRLVSNTRTSRSLRTKCSSGGVLDLTSLDNYVVTEAPSTTTTTTSTTTTTTTPGKQLVPVTITISPHTETNPTVKNRKVKKIKIKGKKKTLRAGKKLRLKAVVTPSNATNKKVRWKSSKKKWATVTKKGVVKAKKKGIGHTVKITAKAKDGSGKKATIKIKIKR
nr:S8 family serine peptidase [Eubacterium sp.]